MESAPESVAKFFQYYLIKMEEGGLLTFLILNTDFHSNQNEEILLIKYFYNLYLYPLFKACLLTWQ